jgi:hypothetical protein
MCACQLEARDWKSSARAAGANDDLFSLEPEPALGLDGVRVHEACGASMLLDSHSQRIDLSAQERMRLRAEAFGRPSNFRSTVATIAGLSVIQSPVTL